VIMVVEFKCQFEGCNNCAKYIIEDSETLIEIHICKECWDLNNKRQEIHICKECWDLNNKRQGL